MWPKHRAQVSIFLKVNIVIDTFIYIPLKWTKLPLMKFEQKDVEFKCVSFFSQGLLLAVLLALFEVTAGSRCGRKGGVVPTALKLCQSCWIPHQFTSRSANSHLAAFTVLWCKPGMAQALYLYRCAVQWEETPYKEGAFVYLPS